MLALQRREDDASKSTANILPCRIHYDGPTRVTKRYWSPQVEQDGTATSYFRGRKMRGKFIKLPPGYRGVVARSTNRTLSQPGKTQAGPTYTTLDEDIEIAEDEDDEPPEPIKILEETSSFEDIIVWGHDLLPTSEDPFVKGIEEWTLFAEAIHGTPNTDSKDIRIIRTEG